MKKKIYILCFLAFTVTALSQRQTLYNQKGDEAMSQFNYTDASIWYEEGVSNCNMYSISQLTEIWLADESMRLSMYSVMSRCLTCLKDRATETKDTVSIKKIILYYTEGIGAQVNDGIANFWREQLEVITNPVEQVIGKEGEQQLQTKKGKNRINVFIGYSMNMLAPVGFTVGVTGKYVGGYVRYRTNLSSQQYTEICDDKGNVAGLGEGSLYLGKYLGNKKANTMMITGGLAFKPTQKFLVSIGAGYWKRDLMYEFEKINTTVTASEGNFWAKGEDFSHKGLAIDLDGTYRIGKIFYISAGCSFLNFKYAYGNAGIGIFF